jgi:hypothetical protein
VRVARPLLLAWALVSLGAVASFFPASPRRAEPPAAAAVPDPEIAEAYALLKRIYDGSALPRTRAPRHWVDELLSGEPEMYEGGPASLHRPSSCVDPMRLENERVLGQNAMREAFRELRVRPR